MRFFIALLISSIFHTLIGVGFYIFSDNFKPKPKMITFQLDMLPIEKVSIEPTVEVVPPKDVVAEPIMPEKVILKEEIKPKTTVKPNVKVVPAPIKIPQPMQEKHDTKQVEATEKSEHKDTQEVEKTTNNEVTVPTKNVEKEKKLSDSEIQSFLAKIHHIIYQHKKYPQRAKKLNIEGEVIARFTLYANGDMSDIKIVKSSGAQFLDKHTIETIIEASSSFPKPPLELEIKIPINYFLEQ